MALMSLCSFNGGAKPPVPWFPCIEDTGARELQGHNGMGAAVEQWFSFRGRREVRYSRSSDNRFSFS